jgi:hypothetical protein
MPHRYDLLKETLFGCVVCIDIDYLYYFECGKIISKLVGN